MHSRKQTGKICPNKLYLTKICTQNILKISATQELNKQKKNVESNTKLGGLKPNTLIIIVSKWTKYPD